MSSQDSLQTVSLTLCGQCIMGAGGECHTPGCALWMNRAPDLPLTVEPALPAVDTIAALDVVLSLARTCDYPHPDAAESIRQVQQLRAKIREGLR